jgi:hypothetical protein
LLKDSQEEIDTLKASVAALQAITSEVTLLRHENAAITSEVSTLRQENVILHEAVALLENDVAVLENDVAVLKSTTLQIISLRQSTKCASGDQCTWGTEVVNTARSLFQRSADFKIITIITAGIYRVTARVPAVANQNNYAIISIKLNGTAIVSSYFSGSPAGAAYTGITEVIDIPANGQLSVHYVSNGGDSYGNFNMSVLTIEKLN